MVVYFTYLLDPDLYYDIEGLGSPFVVGIPIGITNNETFTLYFRASIVSPPAGWGSTSKNLGSIAAGVSSILVFDPTRTTPTLVAGELDESITLRIAAYKDAGYTDLYGQADLSTTIHFFNSLDAAWTMIDRDTFDGGTIEGWGVDASGAIDDSISGCYDPEVSTTHFISSPYGLRAKSLITGRHFYKNFNTSGYSKVRVTVHYWITSGYRCALATGPLATRELFLPAAVSGALPQATWVRVAWRFPIGATSALRVQFNTNGFLDEIRIIGKV